MYEEENRKPDRERVDGEYHFSAPEIRREAWSDAPYVPTESACAVPPRYRYAAQPESSPKKKSGRGLCAGAVVALCLVCALLGGAGGGVLVYSLLPERQTETAGTASAPDPTVVIERSAPVSTAAPVVPVSGESGADATAIYERACTQAVGITTSVTYTNFFGFTSKSAVSGSGFLLSDSGYVLTNHHVIEDAAKGGYAVTVLTFDGGEREAAIVGYDEDNDLAVLKIDASGLSPVVVGDSDRMRVGERVYAVGNPLGELAYTMTDGIVSALDREISSTDRSGVTTSINMFQISAAINSGNSGGPVYNERGEVIGVSTAKYASSGVEGIGFAIPINDALAVAEELITKGYVSGKAYLGVETQTISAAVAQYYGMVEGAFVHQALAGSPAETAGLRAGDIIVALDETPIASRAALAEAKRSYHAGDSATLRVYRSGTYLELTVTFGEEVPAGVSGQAD